MLIKLSLFLLCIAFGIGQVTAAAPTVYHRLLYIGDQDSDAYLGVSQGVKEGNLAGAFLSIAYKLENTCTKEHACKKELANLGIKQGETSKHPLPYRAIFMGHASEDMLRYVAMRVSVPVFNLTNKSISSRAICVANLFHVSPSHTMLKKAEQQWQQKHPEDKAKAQAWHHTFKKYAARDLNKRFLAQHGKKMNDASWAGWATGRSITDALTRNDKIDELVAYMYSYLFDGQKGDQLKFRKSDGQLQQPLLLVSDEVIVGEAPVRGVADPKLGLAALLEKSACEKQTAL